VSGDTAVTVLARLGYVDVRHVAAHGHRKGAFVTTLLVAADPGDVRVASHTTGGVLLDAIYIIGRPAPALVGRLERSRLRRIDEIGSKISPNYAGLLDGVGGSSTR
jgi:hypothetical protein